MYPQRDLNLNRDQLKDIELKTRSNDIIFPPFTKPNAVGCFSVNSDRGFEYDAGQLRYYNPPTVATDMELSIDLNEGFAVRHTKNESAYSEGIENLLRFIIANRSTLLRSENERGYRLDAEYVCFRGLLSLIMNTPYEKRNNWCIHVTRFKGTFYMWRPDTVQNKQDRERETQRLKRMTSWGFKFEQCTLSSSPQLEPNTNIPVDECAEFCCVFKTKINSISILYAAEMDGILSNSVIAGQPNCNELRFVELKTQQQCLNRGQMETYNRHKTRRWWIQAFLVGIQDIFVGLRTEVGILKRIHHIQTNELPKVGQCYWNPPSCANFLCSFLKCVKATMGDVDCPQTVYAFHFDAESSRFGYESFCDKNIHSFLPDWYLLALT